jgi:Amidases related to nicotinamidase
MILDVTRSSLLLIDFQEKLMPAIDAAEASVREALRLAQSARLLDVPVLATEQTPDRLGSTVPALADHAAGALAKSTFDACPGCDIEAALGDRPQVVITGWESHVCVLQTAFGLMSAGRSVYVVADAVSSRTPANKAAALARMSAAA